MRMVGRDQRLLLALVLVSAALLAFQIALLQIIATSQWHHFAAFVIAIALLGFGAAGTFLSLARGWMVRHQNRLLPLLLCACAIALAGTLWLTAGPLGGFDSLLLFVNFLELLRLVAAACMLMLPFLCGALAIGLIFTAGTERIGRYYFANMLGSGLGCILGLVALAELLPQQLPPLLALLALAAAVVLMPTEGRRVVLIGMLIALLVTAGALHHPAQLPLSQYKDLSRTLALPGARIVARQPAAAGLVHVITAPGLRSAAGVSLNWIAPLPPSAAVFVNGDLVGSLPPPPGTPNPRDASTHALPYVLGPPQNVLVLAAGTGRAVVQARSRGASRVVAVESHGPLVEVLAARAPQEFGPRPAGLRPGDSARYRRLRRQRRSVCPA
jgi:hypothetical protein